MGGVYAVMYGILTNGKRLHSDNQLLTEKLNDYSNLNKNNTAATKQGIMQVSVTRPSSEFRMYKLLRTTKMDCKVTILCVISVIMIISNK